MPSACPLSLSQDRDTMATATSGQGQLSGCGPVTAGSESLCGVGMRRVKQSSARCAMQQLFLGGAPSCCAPRAGAAQKRRRRRRGAPS